MSSEEPSSRRSSRFSMRSKQVGQILLENGDIDGEHVAKALELQQSNGGLFGQILQSMGACGADKIAAALLKQVQVTDVQCEDLNPGASVQAITREQCEAEKLCPFEQLDTLLCVVMGNPLNRKAINAIEEATRLKVKPFKAPWPKIKDLIERSYTDENLSAVAAPPAGLEDELPMPEGLEDAPALDDSAPALEDADAPALEEEPAEIEPEPEVAVPAEPEIAGLDSLDDGASAEVIETDKRGLNKRRTVEPMEGDRAANTPRPKKEAKVNIDLDNFDVNAASETIDNDRKDESLEEIEDAAPAPAAAAPAASAKPAAPVLVKFKPIADSYFYAPDAPPPDGEERTTELFEAIDQLPFAEVVAGNVGEFQRANAPRPAGVPARPAAAAAVAVSKVASTKAIEWGPCPADPLTAERLSDDDFSRLTLGMVVDPVGEWNWDYTAPGPVTVDEYQPDMA